MKKSVFDLYKNEIKINEIKRIEKMRGFENERYVMFSRHYNIYNLFYTLIQILEENDIEYLLTGGLLIGLFRHNNSFVPWDDDIDIIVFEKDKEKLLDLDLPEPYTFIQNKNLVYKFVEDGFKNDDELFIDIFFFGEYENELYRHVIKSHAKWWPNDYLYYDEIFPLKEVDFHLYLPDGKILQTKKINIPNKFITYLNRLYPNWQNKYVLNNCHNSFYSLYRNKLMTDPNYQNSRLHKYLKNIRE